MDTQAGEGSLMHRTGGVALFGLTLVGVLLVTVDAGGEPPASHAKGLAAFATVASVLTGPRCLNCHQAERPLQGDSAHAHIPRVERGPDGQGAIGMRCSACHSARANNESSGVPGAPSWSLAPLSMLWQGLSPGALCQALKDPTRNGKRDGSSLITHIASDPLVGWGWNPGAGRTPVPVPRPELVKAMKTWVDEGMPCPVEVTMKPRTDEATTAGKEP